MKLHLKISPVVLCLAFFLSGVRAAELQAGGPESIDLGVVRIDERKEFQFLITNHSDDFVSVGMIDGMCSCLSANLEGDPSIAPGSQRTVRGQIRFGRNLGVYQTGLNLTIQDAKGENHGSVVYVQGKVTSAMVCTETAVNFGSIAQGRTVTPVDISAHAGNTDEPWNGICIADAGNSVVATVSNSGNEQGKISVQLLPANLPIGMFRQVLTLYPTNNGEKLPYPVRISLTAHVKGALQATPASLYLGEVNPASEFTRSIKITSEHSPMNELTAEDLPPNMHITQACRDEHTVVVTVHYIVPSNPGSFTEKLVLTDNHSGARIALPCFGLVN